MNLYELVNEELKRMYDERDMWLKMSMAMKVDSSDGRLSGERYRKLDNEIIDIRKKLFSQIENYDKKIQEKIAELALTGNTNE